MASIHYLKYFKIIIVYCVEKLILNTTKIDYFKALQVVDKSHQLLIS